jgi:hypothetical protein
MRLFRRRERTAVTPYAPRHAGWANLALPPTPSPAADPAVRLGFADGTEVELDGSHPNAVALRTVADVIARELG